MATASLYSTFTQPSDAAGAPLAGGLLYFYTASTTTPITVYQDSGALTPHANPVVADASGIFAPIYVSSTSYKTVLKTAAGITVQTVDNIGSSAVLTNPRINDATSTDKYTIVASELTADRNITLPVLAADDTFTFNDATQTLTNKSLKSSTTRVVDNLDTTKKLALDVSGIATATTRTLTVLNKDGTMILVNDAASGLGLINGTIVPSVSASALTIAIKTLAGNDPTAGDPVYVAFRNATGATGNYSTLAITAATSLVISSGSTMGFTSATASRLWLVGFNDAGTFRLGAVNTVSSTSIMALRDDLLLSSTAEGGAGAADSAQVIYSGAAVTSKAMRLLAYMDWSAGLVTAGTWAIVPTYVQLFGPGVSKPGDVLQVQSNKTGALATTTTVMPNDDTIPQNTEGAQFLSQAITPNAAPNLLRVTSLLNTSLVAAGVVVSATFQDSVASALIANETGFNGFFNSVIMQQLYLLAATASSTTFKVRAGPSSAVTVTINGSTSARLLGGVLYSWITVEEIMA